MQPFIFILMGSPCLPVAVVWLLCQLGMYLVLLSNDFIGFTTSVEF